MKITKREDGYWITECPTGVTEMGPYSRTAAGLDEARDDLRGVERFIKVNKKLFEKENE